MTSIPAAWRARSHRFELAEDALARPGCVTVVGSEIADGIVTPVISQPSLDQIVVVHELVDRHEFDSRDAETLEMLDNGRVCDTGIGAPLRRGDFGVLPRQAAYVGLVDNGVLPGRSGPAVISPLEGGVDHDRLRHRSR